MMYRQLVSSAPPFLVLAVLVIAFGRDLQARQGRPDRFSLQGRVVESTGHQPIEGVSVFVAKHQKSAVTEWDGSFVIDQLPGGPIELVFRLLGYAELTTVVNMPMDTVRLFFLEPVNIQVKGVTITGIIDKEGLMGSGKPITVLGIDDLHRSRGQTLGQSIAQVPGVTLLQTGPSIAKPVIRGLHSQRILTLHAGVRQEGQQWGSEHAPEIDPFIPTSIEVLRGAASVEYGSDAIGGVVRLRPRELRRNAGYAGDVSLNLFSNNGQGAVSGWVEGMNDALPSVAWRVQGSVRYSGDAATPEYRLANTAFREQNASASAGYMFDRGEVTVYASHFGTDLGVFSGAHIGNTTDLLLAIGRDRPLVDRPFSYTVANPRQAVSHDLVTVQSAVTISEWGKLTGQYGWQTNHRQEFDAHGSSAKPAFDLTLWTHTLDLKLQHLPVGGWAGTFGVSGTRQGNVSEGTALLIPNFLATNVGGYWMGEWGVADWVLSAGLRYDVRRMNVYAVEQGVRIVKGHPSEDVAGAVGAIYRFLPLWSVAVNLGTAWRPPTVNELYSYGVHHGSAQFEVGNLNLGLERSVGVETTLRHVSDQLHFELGVYRNFLPGYIFLQPDPEPTLTIRGAFPTFHYRQSDATLTGMDGSVEYHVTDLFTLGGTFSVIRGNNRSTGQPLLFIPADRVRILGHVDPGSWKGWEHPFFELGATLVRRQDRFPAGVDYADPPGGYLLVDLEAGAEVNLAAVRVHINISIANMFNTTFRDYLSRYRYFADDPGRNVVIRVRVPWAVQ